MPSQDDHNSVRTFFHSKFWNTFYFRSNNQRWDHNDHMHPIKRLAQCRWRKILIVNILLESVEKQISYIIWTICVFVLLFVFFFLQKAIKAIDETVTRMYVCAMRMHVYRINLKRRNIFRIFFFFEHLFTYL